MWTHLHDILAGEKHLLVYSTRRETLAGLFHKLKAMRRSFHSLWFSRKINTVHPPCIETFFLLSFCKGPSDPISAVLGGEKDSPTWNPSDLLLHRLSLSNEVDKGWSPLTGKVPIYFLCFPLSHPFPVFYLCPTVAIITKMCAHTWQGPDIPATLLVHVFFFYFLPSSCKSPHRYSWKTGMTSKINNTKPQLFFTSLPGKAEME